MQNLGAHKFYITWRSTVCIIQGNLQTGSTCPSEQNKQKGNPSLVQMSFAYYSEMHGESVQLDIVFNLVFCLDSFEHLDSLADVSRCRAP